MTTEGKVLIGIGAVTLALFIGGIFMLTKKSEPVLENANPAVLIRENSEATGSAEPTVTLVEFGDYQCPYCAEASPVLQDLLAAYPEKLRFVFRHYPLSTIHPNAQIAAEAADAAGAQSKYWEMHELLFENQGAWEDESNPVPKFEEYAQQLSLNLDEFSQALKDRTFRTAVQEDFIDGNTLGINSTPTFFVDNQRFTGSMAQLIMLIESKLQQ